MKKEESEGTKRSELICWGCLWDFPLQAKWYFVIVRLGQNKEDDEMPACGVGMCASMNISETFGEWW